MGSCHMQEAAQINEGPEHTKRIEYECDVYRKRYTSDPWTLKHLGSAHDVIKGKADLVNLREKGSNVPSGGEGRKARHE